MLSREQVEELGDFLCEENLSQTAEKFLAHDAALRERVGELERRLKTFACEKCFCNMMFLCAENDPLAVPCGSAGKQEWCKCGYCDIQLQLATLTTSHQQAVKERDNWHAIVKDECDEDEEFRKAAGAFDTSDSYGVESHTEILQRMLTHLQQAVEALAGVEKERDKLTDDIGFLLNFDAANALSKLQAKLQAVEAALKLIAGYAKENGCCPYGCDTPVIASNALAALHGTGGQ